MLAFLGFVEQNVNRLTAWAGKLAAVLALLMVLVVFVDVILRYAFNAGSIALQELEWHLFASMFLIGIAYTMREDAHVRVDVFYTRLSSRGKALVNLGGALFFVLPFSALIVWHSYDFVSYAWQIDEQSSDPGGLPHRYIIKAVIPLSFMLIFVAGLGLAARSLRTLIDSPARDGGQSKA